MFIYNKSQFLMRTVINVFQVYICQHSYISLLTLIPYPGAIFVRTILFSSLKVEISVRKFWENLTFIFFIFRLFFCEKINLKFSENLVQNCEIGWYFCVKTAENASWNQANYRAQFWIVILLKNSSRLSEFQETAKNGSRVMDYNIFRP